MNRVILSICFCSIKMNLYTDKVTNMNKAKYCMNKLGHSNNKKKVQVLEFCDIQRIAGFIFANYFL